MKSEKIMNIFFYIFNTISVFCFAYVLTQFHIPEVFLILILSFYAFTYYCHCELKQYIIDTYYIEKKQKDVVEQFIEDNAHRMGYYDYKIDNDININNYTDDQIKQALKFYYYK